MRSLFDNLRTSSGKPKLDRAGLETQGIFYLDRPVLSSEWMNWKDVIGESKDLPKRIEAYLSRSAHVTNDDVLDQSHRLSEHVGYWRVSEPVEWLRELLVDRSQLIPSHAADSLLRKDERSQIPLDSGIIFDDERYEGLSQKDRDDAKERYRQIFDECRQVAQQACRHLKSHVSEHDWQYFMEVHIFRRYPEGRRSLFDFTSDDDLFDSYETRSNVQWNESRGQISVKDMLSDPKPDLFFAFPIQRPGQQAARGLERSALVYNFSLAKLHTLTHKGLYSIPTTGLARYRPDKPFTRKGSQSMSNDHMVCFPFAVVELKHGSVRGSQEEFCFCQAANAASTALAILEQLYKFADQQQSVPSVPPVVAFTCIGPSIRLWIAHSIREPNGASAHLMICVWEKEMTSTWAVIEMQAILKNLMRWATRVLRPGISTQISRWDAVGDPDHMFENSARVAHDRKPFSRSVDENYYWRDKAFADKDHGLKRHQETEEQILNKKART